MGRLSLRRLARVGGGPAWPAPFCVLHPVRWTLAAAALCSAAANAQDARQQAGLYAPSAWDLELGAHATELNANEYIDYACGTNGGPPSLPLSDWTEYGRCPAEAETGFHEVYFQYDDELEYRAKANDLLTQIALYEYTSAYEIPVIPSALFDSRGFLVGLRMVTDPRVPVEIRERGVTLGNFLRARYGPEGWSCEELPRIEGETPFVGFHEKRRCQKPAEDGTARVMLETHNYRKPGQHAIDPVLNRPTVGQFESRTRFELILEDEIPADRVPGAAKAPSETELLAERARDCPGCDLAGTQLKRADLRGANLAGADLTGANLHGAVLTGANLAGASLADANLNRSDFKRADLRGANLRGAMMYEAHFDAADLTGAVLNAGMATRVQFIRANLTDAKMLAMDMRDARLNDANFSGADLSGSLLENSRLTRANLAGARLIQTTLWSADLVRANLTGADLRAADLIRANLRGANLTSADFSYARLTFANLSETTITGAVWIETQLPFGFDPDRP